MDLHQDDNTLEAKDRSLKRGHEEVVTPTTPRPPVSQAFQNMSAEPIQMNNTAAVPQLSSSVPTGQLSQSATNFTFPSGQHATQRGMLYRDSSQTSAQSSMAVDDMDMDASEDDQDDSDNDTENGEPGRSSKKKKGQRFFCTEFPPCNLSFTRSEHLARHIRYTRYIILISEYLLNVDRKHTGERPFQCHCNRRFSRLDNLRQHAQTVHVNEEIPGDSLAATGTRFQRQIRTDRVRPAGNRPRSGTVGSTGGHSRGHSRNLSTSSVGSNASTYSNTPEPHRRPPPLIMANDGSGRPKLGLEQPSTPPTQYRGFSTNSPGGFSTPTSATYSGAPGSPGYGSTMDSPISTTSRGMGFFGNRTPNRRLSVPSQANPFQSPQGNTYPLGYSNSAGPSAQAYPNQSNAYGNTTASTYSAMRVDPDVPPGEDWRRRTWHPSSYTAAGFNYPRPATSGLLYSQTPDAPQPAFAQHATVAAGQAPRLPGIESFDQVQHRPSTPPRRHQSPTRIDPTLQPAPVFATPNVPSRHPSNTSGHQRGAQSLDTSLNNNLTKLDIHDTSRHRKEMANWAQQTMVEIQNAASRQIVSNTQAPMNQNTAPMSIPRQGPQPGYETFSGLPSTPPRNKRQGWYAGPTTARRTSPEDSSSSEGVPTPGTSAAEINPAIMHSNGYIEPHHVLVPEGSANVSLCKCHS